MAGRSYHHGDLRSALLSAAMESLQTGEPFSMRAVARRAHVSPTAPYRHFASRQALDAAVAVEGFRELRADLAAALAGVPEDSPAATVVEVLAMAYIGFALRRPAVFRLMFGNECDHTDDERVQAAGRLHTLLEGVIARLFPQADVPALSTALWATAHGLAFLHLDGKLRSEPASEVGDRVRSSVRALFAMPVPPPAPALTRCPVPVPSSGKEFPS
ncbi:TetR/AcrR family transcriptional regulator [Propionicimonas sp.]|uniref:TetR/AcrR family transcriptional regulator n=1 Tax=Propionicimonas sp. TaxID=1955623 RepID=UPI0039E321F8